MLRHDQALKDGNGRSGESWLGEPAFLYFTEILHRQPKQWFYDIDRLHYLLQSRGPESLRRAFRAR